MKVGIPAAEVAWFRDVLGTEGYCYEERNYKLALHKAISALLAPDLLADSRFPTLLSAVLGEDDPDLSALGIGVTEVEFLRAKGGVSDHAKSTRQESCHHQRSQRHNPDPA